RHARDFVVLFASQGFQPLVPGRGGGVPDPYGLVIAGGDEPQAVRAERHAVARVSMPAEAQDLSSGPRVPDLDRLVFAPDGSEAPAVPAEGQAGDEAGMSCQGFEWSAGGCVPELHGAVVSGRRQPPAVGVECDGTDPILAVGGDGAEEP